MKTNSNSFVFKLPYSENNFDKHINVIYGLGEKLPNGTRMFGKYFTRLGCNLKNTISKKVDFFRPFSFLRSLKSLYIIQP